MDAQFLLIITFLAILSFIVITVVYSTEHPNYPNSPERSPTTAEYQGLNSTKYQALDGSLALNGSLGLDSIKINLSAEQLNIHASKWFPVILNINETQYDCQMRRCRKSFQPKKSYDIKFLQEVELLDLGKSQTWLLLGETFDVTYVRNQLTYKLGSLIGLSAPVFKNIIFNVTEFNGASYYGLYSLTRKYTHKNILPDGNLVDVIIQFDQATANGTLLCEENQHCNSVPTVFDYNNTIYSDVTKIKNKYATLYASVKDIDPMCLSNVLDYRTFVDYFILSEFASSGDAYIYNTYTYVVDNTIYMGFLWNYDLSYGNIVDTVEPFGPNSFTWSCRSHQLYDIWRYHHNNRFIASDYKFDPTNPQIADQYMKTLRKTIDPNSALAFSRSCTNLNLVSYWYIRLFQDPKFIWLLRQRYRELRQTILSEANIMTELTVMVDSLGLEAARDIITWYNPAIVANITNVNNPLENISQAKNFYEQNVNYLKVWIQKRLQWLDAQFVFDVFPNDLNNLNKWPDYKNTCNKLSDILFLPHQSVSYKR